MTTIYLKTGVVSTPETSCISNIPQSMDNVQRDVPITLCLFAVLWVSFARCLLIVLMMEAASASETSVNFYQTTRRNNPEDSHLHISRRENPKSRKIIIMFMTMLIFIKTWWKIGISLPKNIYWTVQDQDLFRHALMVYKQSGASAAIYDVTFGDCPK
jgi:hypothetical protein